MTTLDCTGRDTVRPVRIGSVFRNRCPSTHCGPRSKTPSASPGKLDFPGFGTPLAWPAGGIWVSISSGCSTAWSTMCLLFATPHWRRLVPTSWDVFPNALSVLIQYLSLHWPTEHGWVAYNSLQLIAYFITVFVAAPLALITGLGMSPALSTRFKPISKVLSIQTARSLHFLVLAWFLVFILIHVSLVFTTGLLRNLNHIYAGRNDDGSVGLLDLCSLHARRHRRLGSADAVFPASSAGGAAGRLRAGRPGAAAVRARRLHSR